MKFTEKIKLQIARIKEYLIGFEIPESAMNMCGKTSCPVKHKPVKWMKNSEERRLKFMNQLLGEISTGNLYDKIVIDTKSSMGTLVMSREQALDVYDLLANGMTLKASFERATGCYFDVK